MPNPTAHRLSLGRTRAIGVMIPQFTRPSAALPIVLLDAENPRFVSLLEDPAQATAMATRHLIELGHRVARTNMSGLADPDVRTVDLFGSRWR